MCPSLRKSFYSTESETEKLDEIPKLKRKTKAEKNASTGPSTDPTGWHVTEKLDGVRVYWNSKGELFTSTLKKINAPTPFLRNFPTSVPMEGELWSGYNSYQKTFDLVHNPVPNLSGWKDASFNVFDAPTRNDLKYEERISEVTEVLKEGHITAKLMPSIICKGKEHLYILLKEITSRKGEGLIIRKPNSFYNDKNTFLKVKENDDCDVLVLAHQKKFLECLHQSGTKFLCSNPVEFQLPPVGSIISVKYIGLNDQTIPQRAIYHRYRPDLNWEEISKKAVPYYVSKGKTSMPSCRGCGRQIDKSELRIKTTLMFVPPGCGPLPVQINFCLNINCIQQAIKKYSQQGTEISTFDGRIWVSKDMNSSEIPAVPGFSWTFIDPKTHFLQTVEDPSQIHIESK